MNFKILIFMVFVMISSIPLIGQNRKKAVEYIRYEHLADRLKAFYRTLISPITKEDRQYLLKRLDKNKQVYNEIKKTTTSPIDYLNDLDGLNLHYKIKSLYFDKIHKRVMKAYGLNCNVYFIREVSDSQSGEVILTDTLKANIFFKRNLNRDIRINTLKKNSDNLRNNLIPYLEIQENKESVIEAYTNNYLNTKEFIYTYIKNYELFLQDKSDAATKLFLLKMFNKKNTKIDNDLRLNINQKTQANVYLDSLQNTDKSVSFLPKSLSDLKTINKTTFIVSCTKVIDDKKIRRKYSIKKKNKSFRITNIENIPFSLDFPKVLIPTTMDSVEIGVNKLYVELNKGNLPFFFKKARIENHPHLNFNNKQLPAEEFLQKIIENSDTNIHYEIETIRRPNLNKNWFITSDLKIKEIYKISKDTTLVLEGKVRVVTMFDLDRQKNTVNNFRIERLIYMEPQNLDTIVLTDSITEPTQPPPQFDTIRLKYDIMKFHVAKNVLYENGHKLVIQLMNRLVDHARGNYLKIKEHRRLLNECFTRKDIKIPLPDIDTMPLLRMKELVSFRDYLKELEKFVRYEAKEINFHIDRESFRFGALSENEWIGTFYFTQSFDIINGQPKLVCAEKICYLKMKKTNDGYEMYIHNFWLGDTYMRNPGEPCKIIKP